MRRGVVPALAALVIVVIAATATARADELGPQIDQLAHAESYKVRLAAAIELSKSSDPRAVAALATALTKDDEATIRRVCALALGKIIDESTPAAVRTIALEALDHAARSDRDAKVRAAAAKAHEAVAALVAEPSGGGPAIFVDVGTATDQTGKGPPDLEKKLASTVKGVVKHDYAVEWPGGGALPTRGELERAGTHAYFVAATVQVLDIAKKGSHATIACTVSIRVAPWEGSDGNEKWQAAKAASASGSGKAETGAADGAVAGGIRDCVLAVAEQVAQQRVLPFIKRLAAQP